MIGITASELAQMRADQAASLPDVCTIRRRGEWVETGGASVYTPGPVCRADVPCRIDKPTSRDVEQHPVASADAATRRYIVTLPWLVQEDLDGLVLVPTRSTDPWLTGRFLAVQGELGRSWATGRRVTCDLTTHPE